MAVVVSFLIFATYASASYYHKVLPNIYLLGKNLNGMTYDQAIKYFEQNPPSVSGNVIFKAGEITKKANPTDLGITVDMAKSVQTAIGQNRFWQTPAVSPGGVLSFLNVKKKVNPVFTVDNKAFSAKLHDLYKDEEVAPTDASIAVENGAVVVKPEKGGRAIETDKAREKLTPFLPKGKIPIVSLEFITVNPKVKASELEPVKNFLASHISGPIELIYKNRKIAAADISTIISWLDNDKLRQNEISIKQDSLKSWLNDNVIAKVAVKAKPILVSSENQDQIIDAGRPGVTVDSEVLAKEVVKIINENPQDRKITVPTAEVQPEREVVSPGYTLGKYPGKYIEMNLSAQMLYTIEGNNLIGSYRVSTGKWSMPTPQGEFAITCKLGRAYSSEYNLYMPFFMGFIGSMYGIHELPEWANGTKEGEGHLGTPVSHGCVRLGVGPAETVYNWADIGTPVYIHK